MSGKTLGWSGDANDPTSLAIGIAKLETFCRNLEDKIDKNEESADDVVKLRVELDELKGKVSELKARLVSIEDLQEEVESAKKILKMLNPKTLLASSTPAPIRGGNQSREFWTSQSYTQSKDINLSGQPCNPQVQYAGNKLNHIPSRAISNQSNQLYPQPHKRTKVRPNRVRKIQVIMYCTCNQ